MLRSRIVLMLADGYGVKAVAERLGIAPATVRLWRRRFGESGPEGLLRDAAGRGRKPLLDSETRRSLREQLGAGADPPLRERARALGVSVSTVSRWRRRSD
ncbi:MAG: helix-turn-helix domain-containing protein [Vicinamibacterales bacterium]